MAQAQPQAYPTPLLKNAKRRSQNVYFDTYQYRQLFEDAKKNKSLDTNNSLEQGW